MKKILVALFAIVPSYIAHLCFANDFWGCVCVVIVSLLSVIISVLVFGLSAGERRFVFTKLHLI